MSYIFEKIVVKPHVPKTIEKLYEISNNLWWSWNTDFLNLFKQIDVKLWDKCEKNPIKFLKNVSQDSLEKASKDSNFLKQYKKQVENFEDYMNAKDTWFSEKYPENRNDLIAYFSAEYGLDETIPIYSGGLGILSGDHLKTSSDMGIPLVGIGLLYKNGYFNQIIDGEGNQIEQYNELKIEDLPINKVKDKDGKDLKIRLKFPEEDIVLQVWKINVGRNSLYLMDSDFDNNKKYRDTTKVLYGGDQDMRIRQEMVLGIAGVKLLKVLGLNPTIYHMNEGHSAFLNIELIKNAMDEKKVSFNIAKEIVSSKTAFTTHTPVPAGNDIFPVSLIEKYFSGIWNELGISEDEFLKLGMKPNEQNIRNAGFNMGILALKIAGLKNGVSKLHGSVSRELFGDVWPEVPAPESPIGYVTNGIHTCSWISSSLKSLYNKYLEPYWQDKIEKDETWENVKNIPDEELWDVHQLRKAKLLDIVKEQTSERMLKYGHTYDEIRDITKNISKDKFTIGFARRFATYKRATLIFRDLERITKIFNEQGRPVQIIFAGKAHPQDSQGKDLIKYIHELSLKPGFKGKVFILENYNIGVSRYLVSGVDVWLNNPRRPLEASGTSGQKAAANGVINFSVLDGWWAEGYNGKNGWTIGNEKKYRSYEEQDNADSNDMYQKLENAILPVYYNKNERGYSEKWVEIMKESIRSNAGKYSTARMLEDYCERIYIPLININKKYYQDLSNVTELNSWIETMQKDFSKIKITQERKDEKEDVIDAGDEIEMKAKVTFPSSITKDDVKVQGYIGRIDENGVIKDAEGIDLNLVDEKDGNYEYEAKLKLKSSGNYGYTFRVIPQNNMILNPFNLNLIKWID